MGINDMLSLIIPVNAKKADTYLTRFARSGRNFYGCQMPNRAFFFCHGENDGILAERKGP